MENAGKQSSDEMNLRLAINELLQIQLQNDPSPSTYRSRIENIVDQKLLVSWPTSSGIRMPIHADQMLNLSLVREGNAYAFTGLVDRTVTDPLPQIIVIVNSEIHRIQRRQNFRIKSLIPIEISGEVKGSSENDAMLPLFFKTTTYNISAGGVAVRSPKGVPEGSILESKLALPDQEPIIKAPCRVIYNEPAIDNPRLQQSGMKFLVISEKEKARMVRFIYRTQLKGMRD
jgi:c-di-GMP-binding flagellar brake protein YcgR